jgi:hypothetical protein
MNSASRACIGSEPSGHFPSDLSDLGGRYKRGVVKLFRKEGQLVRLRKGLEIGQYV